MDRYNLWTLIDEEWKGYNYYSLAKTVNNSTFKVIINFYGKLLLNCRHFLFSNIYSKNMHKDQTKPTVRDSSLIWVKLALSARPSQFNYIIIIILLYTYLWSSINFISPHVEFE